MKLYDFGLLLIVMLIVVGGVGVVSHKMSKNPHHCGKEEHVGHDGPIEEMAEDVIKTHTGMDFDLTPSSIEK